ncbi:MAG TPA: response regulator transcription factor [Aggregatilinea sp.]|jgi:DNA-binding NarL/FixJ family response regulator|uniref:response regulator transcription factor n=1 Tax=Aggregatilinea sp. TaxID=2806333 RepID=UPI002C5A6C33|nr:response regulator transcription factor [Aggregatilinea sp.]HML20629.1 response regulator transcription factor [Aggregatilinea sp.]
MATNSQANVTRILLADDHAILRAGLKLLLDAQPDLNVVGEASNGARALALAEDLLPDLILLDLTMPGLGGLEVLRTIKEVAPSSRVLVLTMHEDESHLRQALALGAAGYVLKKAVDSELLNAIRAVMRGEVYVHSAMMEKLLNLEANEPASVTPTESGGNPWDALSKREADVLRLVALGYTNTEIADQLALSVKTVETYRARGMEKLGLSTRAQLVRDALARGLLDEQ